MRKFRIIFWIALWFIVVIHHTNRLRKLNMVFDEKYAEELFKRGLGLFSLIIMYGVPTVFIIRMFL